MAESRFTVEHVRITSEKPFADVKSAFEGRIGKFEPEAYRSLAAGGDIAAVRKRIEGMAGPSGFMLFGTNDHGALLRMVGQQREALQYVVGNPLLALEMTRYAIGAGLYAPLRVLIYATENGGTSIEYDKPSSLFGQFGDPNADEMARSLDQKLSALVTAAMR